MSRNEVVTPPPFNAKELSKIKRQISVPYNDMKEEFMEENDLTEKNIRYENPLQQVLIIKDAPGRPSEYVVKFGSYDQRSKYNLILAEYNNYKKLKGLRQEYKNMFPKMIEYEQKDHYNYLMIEYVDGVTLLDYIGDEAGNTFSYRDRDIKDLLLILLNITKALHGLCLAGLVHGDLNPQNIMIERDLSVKLIDFEKTTDDMRKFSRNIIGSHQYDEKENNTLYGYIYILGMIKSSITNSSSYNNTYNTIVSKSFAEIINLIHSDLTCEPLYGKIESILTSFIPKKGGRRSLRKTMRKRRGARR